MLPELGFAEAGEIKKQLYDTADRNARFCCRTRSRNGRKPQPVKAMLFRR